MSHQLTHKDLNRLFKRDGFNAVWERLKGHGPARWQLAVEWVEDRIRHIKKRPRSDAQDLERWNKARRVYRRRLKRARKHVREGRRPKFHRWMLNGHPNDIQPQVKRVIAIVIGALGDDGVYVTATTNGTHATFSYHYRHMAVDFGGVNWIKAFDLLRRFGCQSFHELFGPPSGYCKEGYAQAGTSPDVPNHTHAAPMESF